MNTILLFAVLFGTTYLPLCKSELLIGLTKNVTVMEGNNATLCIDFSSEFESNFSINVRLLLPTLMIYDPAIPGEDFDLSNNFSIKAISAIHGPNSSLCFDISVIQDEFVEYEECFEVGISHPYLVSGGEMDDGNGTAAVCIKDEDSVVIGFEETEAQIPENIRDGVKLLCAKVLEGELMREATVMVQYYDQTAVADEDYKNEIIFLIFSQDDTRVCFNVSIIDDNIYEQDEVFFANITTSDPQITLSPNLTTLTIEFDDVVILFIGAPYEGREGNGFVAITVGVIEPEKLKTKISVNLTTKDIVGISNAATAGVDYTPLDETLVFSETVTNITVNVTLLDDNALEGDEDFKAQLSSGSNVRLPDEPEAIITIVDDDRVTIGFEEETVQILENIRMKTLCLNVSLGQLLRTTTVNVSYQDQTAINGEDYSAQHMTFTFSEDNTRVCFDVDILNDNINEPEKKFLVVLTTGDPQVNLSPGTAIITINDELLIGLTQNVTVMEGNNATLCVDFSYEFESNFSINVRHQLPNSTLDSATPGEDFDVSNFSIKAISTIYGPDNSLCFNIFVIEDDFVEYEECFGVGISLPYSVSDHLKVEISEGKDTTAVCIKDNDSFVIGLEETEVQVPEDITDGVRLLCAKVFEGKLTREATIMVQYYDRTAIANDDYKDKTIFLNFSQKNTRVCFDVSIIDDDIHEGDEIFFVNITTSDLQVTLSPHLATLTIKSDDVVNIVFVGDPFEGSEMNGLVAIIVGVMEPEKLKTEVSVNLTTNYIVGVSNAATAGVDYRPLDKILMFSEAVTVITVNVTLLDDNAVEGDEDFKAQLSTSSGSNVILPSPEAIVTIVDDDRVTIGFEEETVKVPVNIRMKTLCVNVLLGQLSRTTVVSVSYQDQTAINGQDYSIQQMTITVSKDHTRVCFDVDILTNDPEKKFLLILTTGDPQVNLSPDTAIITIIDNDDVTFSFGEPVYSFDENMGNATVTVKKVNGSIVQAITLTVSGFLQGELITNTITFGPNDTEIPITFKISDDVIPLEPTEEFELSLNVTDTEFDVLFEPNDKTTIYIVDDDGEYDEDVCLSTPTSEITIYVVVIEKTAEEVCDNQHLKDFLNETINSEFREISKDKCHFKPDYQSSCNPLSMGAKSRTNITIKTSLICGSSCIQHTYRNTSILEVNRQEKAIIQISMLTVKKHRYNQTTDVVIRYFYGEKKPVFYTCEREETSFVQIIGDKNLTLCNCSMECEEPDKDVFTFDKSAYNFDKNMYNATIYVEKTSGSIDRVITLLVTGFAEGPQTVDFYPQDTKKAITFKIFDDKVLESTEKIELLLSPTDRITLIKPHDKTTINYDG